MSTTNPTTADDVRNQLLACYAGSGHLVGTAFIPSVSNKADAEDRFDIRAKNCLREFEEAGLDEASLKAAESALTEHEHNDAAALALVVRDGDVVLNHRMFRPVARLFTNVGPTPTLIPMLEANQSDLPHLAVLLDRVGADIWYRMDLGAAVDVTTVDGDDVYIQRSQPGGWSQPRFQQIAENQWEQNAKDVAASIIDESDEVEALVVAGDVRAVGFFVDAVGDRFDHLITVDGSRAAGPDAFLDNADTAIRNLAAERRVESIQRMREVVGRSEAVTGTRTLELLAQGRIDTLYVGNDTGDENRPVEHVDFSVPVLADEPTGTPAPRTEAAVAMGAATGASVVVLPASTLPDAVAGIVRGDAN